MALELLREICFEYEEGMHLLSKQMKNMFAEASWRCKKRSDWAITPNEQEKSKTGYVGLKNLGCTCYMNSLM